MIRKPRKGQAELPIMQEPEPMELYIDGGSRGNPGPAASAYVIRIPEGKIIEEKGFFLGKATNNVAEYTSLVRGLEAARSRGVKVLHIFSDSELMVRQIIGEYRVRHPDLQTLHEQVQTLLLAFDRWQIKHIRRELNTEADRLVNEILDQNNHAPKKTSPGKTKPSAAKPIIEDVKDENGLKILAEIVRSPEQSGCPAAMQKGQCFVFTDCVPAGLCIHAAQAMLATVIAMREDSSGKSNKLTIKCSHPGCGAMFRLSVI